MVNIFMRFLYAINPFLSIDDYLIKSYPEFYWKETELKSKQKQTNQRGKKR